MEFKEYFFKWWFWFVVVIFFVYFTLIKWRIILWDGIVDFLINFFLSLIVSFFLAVIFFALIYFFLFLKSYIFEINKFINIRNYQ